MKIDDSSVIKDYIEKGVTQIETDLSEKIKRVNTTLTRKIDRMT